MKSNSSHLLILLGLSLFGWMLPCDSFVNPLFGSRQAFVEKKKKKKTTTTTTSLLDGFGVAHNYSWIEGPLEIEVHFKIPKDTSARDLRFRVRATSVGLVIHRGEEKTVLLEETRKMRGFVDMEGTTWYFRDPQDQQNNTSVDCKMLTVVIDKRIRPVKHDLDIMDPFWRGLYPNDDDEVLQREYEEETEFDMREYAASLGVDIDNINMSLVDKTMFTSGVQNMTQKALQDLVQRGLVKETTQQADGSEYTVDEDGEAQPYSYLGDTVEPDELRRPIPFVDTPSPWGKAIPADNQEEIESVLRNQTIADNNNKNNSTTAAIDPIDKLTVKRLKEILREQGLKVSGKKSELKARLRAHVQSMAGVPVKTEIL